MEPPIIVPVTVVFVESEKCHRYVSSVDFPAYPAYERKFENTLI